jgi:hypothetical protein
MLDLSAFLYFKRAEDSLRGKLNKKAEPVLWSFENLPPNRRPSMMHVLHRVDASGFSESAVDIGN